MTYRTLTARFAGTCDGCGSPVHKGERIAWAKGETYHDNCRPARAGDAEDARDAAEYRAGRATASRRSIEIATYGAALVEAWEMEDEMRHAFDY